MKILSAIFLVIIFTSCGNNSTPQIYLPIHRASDDIQAYDIKYHGHLFDKGVTIMCSIVNKTNSINYKDVKLMVKYYSQTNTVMGSNYYIIYKYLNAGSLLKVQLNGARYQSLGNISVEVVNATKY